MHVRICRVFDSAITFIRDTGMKMVPALFVVAKGALYFFKAYQKVCKKCPIETVCWEPTLIEGPIKVEEIGFLVEFKPPQFLGIVIKQSVSDWIFCAREKQRIKLILFYEYRVKDLVMNKLRKIKSNLPTFNDDLMEKIIAKNGSDNDQYLILNVDYDKEVPYNFQEGKSAFENPLFVCMSNVKISFNVIRLDKWEWVQPIEKKEKGVSYSATARENQKKMEEQKEVSTFFIFLERAK